MAKFKYEKDIRRFLFGEMPENELAEFEEKFILDAELFEQIKTVEDELIEKYVRGWMNQAERSKFEQKFPTTTKRREKVEFTRRLIDKIEDSSNAAIIADKPAAEESLWEKIGSLLFVPKIATAAAFSLLVIVFGGWFLYQNLGSLKTEVVRNQNANAPKNTNLIVAPTAELSIDKPNQNSVDNSEAFEKQIENLPADELRKRSDEINKITKTPTPKKSEDSVKETPEPTRTPLERTAPSPVLALFAGRLRSDGKNNVLDLPENASGATLQLNLETVGYKNYIAVLIDADGNLIYRKGELKAAKSRIDFFIPAEKLKRGDYIIKLSGRNDSGDTESVADFQFRVK